MSIHHNHPKGLFLLFFVEMWERFSYYGMRALLMLYMVKYLMFSTEKSAQVYGWYTGLVYLTPLLGGYIADRYLGQRKAIVIGGTLMALGHFAMAFPPIPFFFGAMILLIMGNGFFKPNISTVVGSLYEENDPRRDAGFTIFYMGINLGAMFSPLVCSTLGEKVGWHWGFGAAGVGMVIGLAMYLWANKSMLGDKMMRPAKPKTDYWVPVTLVTLMVGMLVVTALQINGYDIKGLLPNWFYSLAAVLVMIGLVYAYASNSSKSTLTIIEKQRLAVIFIMVFFSIFFWSAFEQAGSSLTLFADRETNRWISLFGWRWEVPAGYFQSLNPFFAVGLSLLLQDVDQPGRDQPRAVEPHKVRHRPGPAGHWLRGDDSGRRLVPEVRPGQHAVAGRRVPLPHPGRAVPLPRRPVAGDQAGAAAVRLADDGRLVPVQRGGRLRGRLLRRQLRHRQPHDLLHDPDGHRPGRRAAAAADNPQAAQVDARRALT